jgi:predicted DNA-binding transcriptional regulator AlpA
MKVEPLKLTMQQIAEMSGESLPVIYSAINAGDLRTFLVGRRRFARPDDVRAWVDHLQAESDAGRPVQYRSRAALADRREVAA